MQIFKVPLLLFFVLSSIKVFSQTEFFAADVQFNNGTKEVLYVSKFTFDQVISYRKTPFGTQQVFDNNQISKIVFEDGFEFLIADVVIDRNKQLGYSAHEFQSELPFLPLKKRLVLVNSVKGEVSLYHTYLDNQLLLFVAYHDQVEYLRWNEYNIKGQVFRDRTYWAQLNRVFNCEGFDNQKIKGVAYDVNALSKLFVKYNTCNKTIETKSQKSFTNIKPAYAVFAGFRQMNSAIESPFYVEKTKNFSSVSPSIAVEFNLNMGKNDLFTRLGYATFSHKYTSDRVFTEGMVSQSYRSIDFSSSLVGLELGYRRYFTLNSKSSLFLLTSVQRVFSNGKLTLSDPFSTALFGTEKEFELKNTFHFNLGMGALFFNSYGVEIRYQTRYNLTEYSVSTVADLSHLELNLFYRF